MSRARELSRLGNPNIISADSSFNVGFGTTNPKEKVNVAVSYTHLRAHET